MCVWAIREEALVCIFLLVENTKEAGRENWAAQTMQPATAI